MEDNIEVDIPRRFLGFNIPGMSPEDTLSFFKQNFTKEYSKLIQEYTPYKGDELERANKSKLKSMEKNKKGNGGARGAQQNPTNMKLNPVELAYYLAYNKGLNPVLSDADANKNKQNPVQNENEEDARVQIKPEELIQQKVVIQNTSIMEQEQEQTLCICNKDDGKTMLCCDNCNIWYHLDCLGYTKEAADLILNQDENELWFHDDACKAQYFQNHPDAVSKQKEA